MLAIVCLTGCGGKDHGKTENQQSQSEADKKQYLYMIMENDTMEEAMTLRSLDTGLETYYEYAFSTQFRDKYGSYTTAIHFTPGRIVTIGEIDQEGYLTEIQLSSQVWEQQKVKRFSIDEEKGVFSIADTKYSIRDKVIVFSDGKQIPFSYISKEDVLTVVGMGKKLLSVVVTTGHGTLALNNTDLFEDSFLQLNQNIFAMITGDMDMELPEGHYTLKVANDGWGGTTEIEIVRGQTTAIDLDTLKGEGKKKGLISFQIDVENIEVYIDYKLVDHMQPVELVYGTHVLQIEAEGYSTWKKYLSVNSEEATLVIELDADDSSEDTEATETEAEETESASTQTPETENPRETETEETTAEETSTE